MCCEGEKARPKLSKYRQSRGGDGRARARLKRINIKSLSFGSSNARWYGIFRGVVGASPTPVELGRREHRKWTGTGRFQGRGQNELRDGDVLWYRLLPSDGTGGGGPRTLSWTDECRPYMDETGGVDVGRGIEVDGV